MIIQCTTCDGTGCVTLARQIHSDPADNVTDCPDCEWGRREEWPEEVAKRLRLTSTLPARCPDCGGALSVRHTPEGEPMGWCDLDGPFDCGVDPATLQHWSERLRQLPLDLGALTISGQVRI